MSWSLPAPFLTRRETLRDNPVRDTCFKMFCFTSLALYPFMYFICICFIIKVIVKFKLLNVKKSVKLGIFMSQ